MASYPTYPLTVFYDGSCPVCSREIGRYRREKHEGRLRFVDITASDFDPSVYGRSREQFLEQLHVRDADGRFFVGVDAFPPIWRALPGSAYRVLAGLVSIPGIHLLATLGYRLFARIRPRLPGRGNRCREDSCHVGHRR